MSKEERICVAQIVGVHGVGGAVKLHCFTADPLDVASYGPLEAEDGKIFRIQAQTSPRKKGGNTVVARIDGVRDRNQAEALAAAKLKLFVSRSKLPKPEKGRHYVADLVGFAVEDEAGKPVGSVADIQNFGAGDIVVIKAGKEELMLPFKPPFASPPDMKARLIKVMIPEGWRDSGSGTRDSEERQNKKNQKEEPA